MPCAPTVCASRGMMDRTPGMSSPVARQVESSTMDEETVPVDLDATQRDILASGPLLVTLHHFAAGVLPSGNGTRFPREGAVFPPTYR